MCSHMQCTKKGSIECPIHANVEKVSQICRSCTVTGRSCQIIGKMVKGNACGDYMQRKCVHGTIKQNKEVITKSLQDLASGDYRKRNRDNKALFDDDVNRTGTYKMSLTNNKCIPETIIKYKNYNYDESFSSTDPSLCSFINNNLLDKVKDEEHEHKQKRKTIPRPVFCPVSMCSKLVAIDSIMSHFYFDHSKLPRITLVTAEPKNIFVKSTNIGSESECLAIILTRLYESSSQMSSTSDCIDFVNNLNKNNKLLLLMGVKIQMSTVNQISQVCQKKVLTKNNYTQTIQTELNPKLEINRKSATMLCGKGNKRKTSQSSHFNNDEVILLWLCKLEDEVKTYTIIVTKEDHKVSYGYTGDAIHIRENQDPWTVYERPECLIVRGQALNKLLDSENNFKIIVNGID